MNVIAFWALECPMLGTRIGECHAHYAHSRDAVYASRASAAPWFSGGSMTELSVTDRLIESVDDFLHTLIDPVQTVQSRLLIGMWISRAVPTLQS
jgi:hypothetical protein